MAAIPKLEDCSPGITPTGFCVLVAMAEVDRKIGNIFVPDATADKEQVVEQRGRIVAVSPVAFDFATFPNEQLPKQGDAVIIAKLSGVQTKGADGRVYRLCQDRDILAVLSE